MEHVFTNVRSILDKYKVIHVPYYQREYVWGTKNNGRNLYKFIDDIFTQYKENPSTDYFIGTLAFCSERVNDVIDGQQRLTSLILILTVLANNKCSQAKQDENYGRVMPDGDLIIQEGNYLTEEIKYGFKWKNNFNTQGYRANISKTIDRIEKQISDFGTYQTNWYDSLYDYILDRVKFISLEYSNIGESLKYFLNINSLSVPLTQNDIFYSILSQSLRIINDDRNIFVIKERIKKLADYKGVATKIRAYLAYEGTQDYGEVNIVYIFLNAIYQSDTHILQLDETGIGKWLSFYKNEIFTDKLKAKSFVDCFLQYLDDFETLYGYFSNLNGTDVKSPIYTAWVLLQYEKYEDLHKFFLQLFRTRHNYIDGTNNLYKDGTKELNITEINEIAKRLNLTLLGDYIRISHDRLSGFTEKIKLNSSNNYIKSIDDIVGDIMVENIFNLNYNDKKNISNLTTKDDSRIIKIILSIQEAYLNDIANGNKEFNEYLNDLLTQEKFSIEHLYSAKEFGDTNRLNNWQRKGKFLNATDFDTERFKFENLSLLNKGDNSSANDDIIYDKLKKYKAARKVCNSEPEYLIQSFVSDSDFYANSAISSLNLPNRTLTNIDQNTWEHSSNNRDFNVKLTKLALKLVAAM